MRQKRASTLINKFRCFTNGEYNLNFVLKTKTVKSFFALKHKNLHPSCKGYHENCFCGEKYVEETKRPMRL